MKALSKLLWAGICRKNVQWFFGFPELYLEFYFLHISLEKIRRPPTIDCGCPFKYNPN